jgi:hypothetical protein
MKTRPVHLLFLMSALCAASAANAADIDWGKVETTTIKTFYPGVASWEFLRGQDHGTGAAPVKTMKKACVECHVGDTGEYDINANAIITGELMMAKSKNPLEPSPGSATNGFIDVATQITYDADTIYMRFQWAGSGASVADPALAQEHKIDKISVQLANKISSFNSYGCYVTCHDDQEGMPENRGEETHLYTYYSRSKGAVQARDKLDGYLANGQFIDLWEAGFVGSEVKTEDMYVLEDRIGDNNDLTAAGSYENGTYTVVISRKLATGDTGDINLADGEAFSIGLAIHNDRNSGRQHYTSFPHSIGLSTSADINAQKN